jgi:biotin carboxyl carrier protein
VKVELLVDGEVVAVDMVRQGDRLRITRDGHTIEARLVYSNGTVFELEVGSRHVHAVGHAHGAQRELWVNGRTLRYERLIEGRVAGPAAGGSLAATIPAIVARVLVQPGDAVQTGDKLVVLESMKMVINIVAPNDGVVDGVFCTAGQAVEAGVPLVALRQA